MVDSMCIHKSLNTNVQTVMKNPEMLKLVPDHLKTKQLCSSKITLSNKICS